MMAASDRERDAAPAAGVHSGIVATTVRSLLQESRAAGAFLPALKKPAVLRTWLLGARRAQIALATWIVLLVIVLPPAFTSILESYYRPQVVTTKDPILKKIDIKRTVITPRETIESRRALLLSLSWMGALASVGALLWLHIPVAVARAGVLARAKEAEADAALASQPTRSILLYREALALATDPAYEAEIRAKLDSLDRRVSASLSPKEDPSPTVPPPSSAGATIAPDGTPSRRVGPQGRYEILSELGRGGMGVVYLATDTVLGRDVALKELPSRLASDEGFASRFRQEARALAKLTHPHIVQVFDLFEHEGRLWMALEVMEGGDLDAMLRRVGKLPVKTAVEMALQLAGALAFAHSKGIVHRDFKPMNVLLTGERVPKITDFGLAKLAEASMHTQEGAVLGSPRYMSPEQAAGKPADHRADVYAFGVTLFQMLTGKVPFEGDTTSLLAQHITQPPPPPRTLAPEIPQALEAVVLRMLEKDPERRTPDMPSVIAALHEFAGG